MEKNVLWSVLFLFGTVLHTVVIISDTQLYMHARIFYFCLVAVKLWSAAFLY